MRVYITGIAGFLGSHLRDWLWSKGHEVTGCDDLSTGHFGNAKSLEIFDITTPEAIGLMIKQMQGCQVVYHCAAAAYEGVSVFSPAFISKNIYIGSANVFSAAIQAGVQRIVNCSSMARYGVGSPPFKEVANPVPVDPYGLAKLSAERLLQLLAKAHGIDYAIAVPHNIYGPRQKYDDPYRNVAAIMLNRALQGKQPVIYGDGEQVRCFSYVSDVVPCLGRMGLEAVAKGQIINLGPDTGEVTINQLARKVCSLMKMPFEPIYMPGRTCEVKHAMCSADKSRSLLGYDAKISFDEGMELLAQDICRRGPKPFDYRLDVEIKSDITPKTWTDKLI